MKNGRLTVRMPTFSQVYVTFVNSECQLFFRKGFKVFLRNRTHDSQAGGVGITKIFVDNQTESVGSCWFFCSGIKFFSYWSSLLTSEHLGVFQVWPRRTTNRRRRTEKIDNSLHLLLRWRPHRGPGRLLTRSTRSQRLEIYSNWIQSLRFQSIYGLLRSLIIIIIIV